MLLGALTLLACGAPEARPGKGQPSPASQPAAAALTAEPALEPPSFAFVPPQPWQSRRAGSTPLSPPDMHQETWRVLVTQNKPLQAKTPLWQPLPADRTVELQMPPGSRWRCSSSPLVVETDADDFGTKLKAWVLTRTFHCSADGFRTWNEHRHQTRVLPDGSHEMGPDAGVLLRERAADHGVIELFVLMRSDKEMRAATTGPPRILPGVRVDDD